MRKFLLYRNKTQILHYKIQPLRKGHTLVVREESNIQNHLKVTRVGEVYTP